MREEPLPRRRVLRGAAAGLTVGAGVNWLRPSARPSPLRDEPDEPAGRDVAADPLSESATPYAVYQYASIAGDLERTLPINVVFPLEHATFEDVIDVFEAVSWYARPAEHVRYAYDRATDAYVRSHWSGAETVFGVAPRLHVRCWTFEDTASVQAHIDTPPTPGHRVASFAQAARAVAVLFDSAGWTVDPGDPITEPLGNAEPPDHDGHAAVIRR